VFASKYKHQERSLQGPGYDASSDVSGQIWKWESRELGDGQNYGIDEIVVDGCWRQVFLLGQTQRFHTVPAKSSLSRSMEVVCSDVSAAPKHTERNRKAVSDAFGKHWDLPGINSPTYLPLLSSPYISPHFLMLECLSLFSDHLGSAAVSPAIYNRRLSCPASQMSTEFNHLYIPSAAKDNCYIRPVTL
jgi:hypothetical protein